jgi:hypothetical protein
MRGANILQIIRREDEENLQLFHPTVQLFLLTLCPALYMFLKQIKSENSLLAKNTLSKCYFFYISLGRRDMVGDGPSNSPPPHTPCINGIIFTVTLTRHGLNVPCLHGFLGFSSIKNIFKNGTIHQTIINFQMQIKQRYHF